MFILWFELYSSTPSSLPPFLPSFLPSFHSLFLVPDLAIGSSFIWFLCLFNIIVGLFWALSHLLALQQPSGLSCIFPVLPKSWNHPFQQGALLQKNGVLIAAGVSLFLSHSAEKEMYVCILTSVYKLILEFLYVTICIYIKLTMSLYWSLQLCSSVTWIILAPHSSC